MPFFRRCNVRKCRTRQNRSREVCPALIRRLARRLALWLLAGALLAGLAGCGGQTDGFAAGGEPEVADPGYQRTPPPLLMPQFGGARQEVREDADGGRHGVIDLNYLSQGYVGASCEAGVEAAFRVIKGDAANGEMDDYPLANNGTPNFFPLARGSGTYTFILFVFLNDDDMGRPTYERYITAEATVTLESEFAPFLVPNKEVDYNADSACVKLSYQLAQHSRTDLEIAQQVYYWISQNISYDVDKAIAAQNNSLGFYTPNPDATLQSKTGICYDYASLAAAMLRANGIPTMLVKGDVMTDNGPAYHAWNLLWLEEQGWVAVELPNQPGSWTLTDTTFAAAAVQGGADITQYIGKGDEYTQISVH